MVDEGYDLKWKNHLPEVFSVVRNLRTMEAFTDVMLYCDGEQFRAHKVILAACSTFFERMLTAVPPDKSKLLVMTETKPEILQSLLDFMYNGEVFVEADALQLFMETAERLEIRGLRKVNNNPATTAVATNTDELNAVKKEVKPRRPLPPVVPINSDPLYRKRSMMGTHPGSSSSSHSEGENDDESNSVERNGYAPPMAKKPRSKMEVVGGRKVFTGLPPGISIEPTGATLLAETMKGAIRVTALPRKSENAVPARAGPSGIVIKQDLARDHEVQDIDDDEEDGSEYHEDGGLKSEFIEGEGQFSNDGADWGDEANFDDSSLGESGDNDNEQYQYQPAEGGAESDERPQNIPPEISTSVPLKQWKPGSLVWQGMTVYSGNAVTTYFCGVCGYKSFNSGNVRLHAMTHTGEVPFTCPVCDHGFRRNDRMKKHMYLVHKIADPGQEAQFKKMYKKKTGKAKKKTPYKG